MTVEQLERYPNRVVFRLNVGGSMQTVDIRLAELEGLPILEFEDDDYWRLPESAQTAIKDLAGRILVKGEEVQPPFLLVHTENGTD